MIEIILTVCAISNPSYCEEKYLQFTFDGSIQQCMMAAQPYIAQWIGQHPEWQGDPMELRLSRPREAADLIARLDVAPRFAWL